MALMLYICHDFYIAITALLTNRSKIAIGYQNINITNSDVRFIHFFQISYLSWKSILNVQMGKKLTLCRMYSIAHHHHFIKFYPFY
jgi:hypothetical protein